MLSVVHRLQNTFHKHYNFVAHDFIIQLNALSVDTTFIQLALLFTKLQPFKLKTENALAKLPQNFLHE